MMEDGDSVVNTMQLTAIDCTEIIDQVVERIAEHQQQHVPNSSAHNTPHSGVGGIANAGDSTPLNGVTPVNQMTGLINGGVGILAQGDNTTVKVAADSRAAGHGHGGKSDGIIPPHGDNNPLIGVGN